MGVRESVYCEKTRLKHRHILLIEYTFELSLPSGGFFFYAIGDNPNQL
jgi:hypothetical protein